MDVGAVDDDFAWYIGCARDITENALALSVPIVSALSILEGLGYLFPSVDHQDPHYFQVTRDRKEQLADFFVNRMLRIHGVEGKEELEKRVQAAFKKVAMDFLESSLKVFEKFNVQHATSVEFYVKVCREEEPIHWPPYRAMGDKSSHPIILLDVPCLEVNIPEESNEKEIEEIAGSILGPEIEEFLIAQEFSHIVHRDPLARAAFKIASGVAGLLPWIAAWSSSISLGGYFVCALSGSFLIHAISEIFFSALTRSQERRAEREALELVGTNRGAVEFFSRFEKFPQFNYFYYPTIQERLQVARDWKPVAEGGA